MSGQILQKLSPVLEAAIAGARRAACDAAERAVGATRRPRCAARRRRSSRATRPRATAGARAAALGRAADGAAAARDIDLRDWGVLRFLDASLAPWLVGPRLAAGGPRRPASGCVLGRTRRQRGANASDGRLDDLGGDGDDAPSGASPRSRRATMARAERVTVSGLDTVTEPAARAWHETAAAAPPWDDDAAPTPRPRRARSRARVALARANATARIAVRAVDAAGGVDDGRVDARARAARARARLRCARTSTFGDMPFASLMDDTLGCVLSTAERAT